VLAGDGGDSAQLLLLGHRRVRKTGMVGGGWGGKGREGKEREGEGRGGKGREAKSRCGQPQQGYSAIPQYPYCDQEAQVGSTLDE
jgi:hypothetical protein